jgi:hypothetical protein
LVCGVRFLEKLHEISSSGEKSPMMAFSARLNRFCDRALQFDRAFEKQEVSILISSTSHQINCLIHSNRHDVVRLK